MEVIGFKKNQEKNLNKKKLIITAVLAILFITIIIIISLYIADKNFREKVDINILKKEISEEKMVSIDIQSDMLQNIYAYDKYITILDNNKLNIYNSSGNLEKTADVEITEPLYNSNNRFLVVAEKDKEKFYFIEGNNIKWEKKLEGKISKIKVNQNGFVSIILTGTTYKSVIVVFNNEGTEMFRTYLSNTVAIDTTISKDNKYLAFAEINTSGTLIQSKIKVVSMEKAKNSPSDAIIYTYDAETDSLAIGINYQDKNNLVCLYNDRISNIINNENKDLMQLSNNDKKINFATISFNNNYAVAYEQSNGLFNKADTYVDIENVSSGSSNLYTMQGTAKEIYSYGEKIAINLGSEVHFINNIGWLIKKYTSSQEIQKIVMSDDIAGIIYGNKVEILSL